MGLDEFARKAKNSIPYYESRLASLNTMGQTGSLKHYGPRLIRSESEESHTLLRTQTGSIKHYGPRLIRSESEESHTLLRTQTGSIKHYGPP